MLSHTIQFLSRSPLAVTMGFPQVSPPSVDRLVSTSELLEVSPSDEMSHTLCFASKVTDGRLTCPYVPLGDPLAVMPGRNPRVHVLPPSVEVAKPMFDEPPPNTRPD